MRSKDQNIGLTRKHKSLILIDLIFNELDYDELAIVSAACIQQMVERLKAEGLEIPEDDKDSRRNMGRASKKAQGSKSNRRQKTKR